MTIWGFLIVLGLLLSLSLWGQGTWERRAPYPIQATEVSGAALNGKVYTICGLLPDGSRSTTLYIYDPYQDAWETGPAIPIPGGADHCNVAAANGRLYVLGAIRVGSQFIDGNTYQFDPLRNQWSTVGRMNQPRGASGVAVIGNRIYVAGGIALASVATVEAFDTETHQWLQVPNMPTPRDHLTAQAIGGKFYAIGGRIGGTDVAANEEFDPATSTWRTRQSMPAPRGGLASGTLRNRIQVFGGEGNSGRPEQTFEQNEEYDPATDTWGALTIMNTPRHGFYGVTIGGRIFTPSGGTVAGANFSNAHDAFYLPLPDAPSIRAVDGVLNAASLRPELAPGGIVTVFGANLSQGAQAATRYPLPTLMNLTSVRVNGTLMPLLYVSPTQIRFVLPYSLVPGQISVGVTHAGQAGEPSAGPVAAANAPGIFTLSGSGEGQGAVLIADTGFLARPRDPISRPAHRGEVVMIFATAVGRLDFPPLTGVAAPNNPVPRTIETPEVTIGGAPAEVVFSGLRTGVAGVFEIDVRVPLNAATGPQVPVQLRIGGRISNTVTIALE